MSLEGTGIVVPGVLNGLDVSVAVGSRLGVVGANGSGKTTLFRILAGALKPVSGSVLVDAAPLSYSRKGRTAHRELVQLVLQEPDAHLISTSVVSDVSFGPLNLGLPVQEVEARATRAMEQLGIAELAHRVPHQLSFGQKKLVALAGALAMQPRYILLDEPTAGLDYYAADLLMKALNTVSDVGIIFTTHEIDFAYEFADEIRILHEGTLHEWDVDLLAAAHLRLPWAPVVSDRLGRAVRRPEDV
ncbi:energy-coupling factor ABC transporter ATP-binding protein [Corynebacterium pyruviciproducens]|uniref:energy-coupling factor ABC transporter ATP-binding protein n=1 Tax=Corynebacterium pyruviciproducens TaxID=598660 RepID=UPI00254E37A1|nr:ABC transporter ATP-binding protein [Corynebacterium pyruviciproducens]MDK6567232.1 ABC transporter ATP-binding protein [Corynebacterium pyruviciproducens]